MNANGINIASGSTIDPQYFFHFCTFQNGASGGTLLKKYNNQASWINSPIFPTNTWGSSYNVYHSPTAGSLDIQNASGGFFGAAFEDDPGGRIFWTNISPDPTIAHSPLPPIMPQKFSQPLCCVGNIPALQTLPIPLVYIVKMGTDPTMSICQTTYKEGGTRNASDAAPTCTGGGNHILLAKLSPPL